MTFPLSAQLREGTKDSHRLAEGTAFIREFFAGRLTRESYRNFLVQLHAIYSALEEAQERHRAHAVYKNICFPQLYRLTALEQDLNFYYGDESWREIPLLEATSSYTSRILELSNTWVEGLVAHHYTRYLGDLSGGQILKRMVAKMFNLSSGDGLSFYDFPEISDHGQFKNEYRARMDVMLIDDVTAQKIVDEANHAFELNRRVFDSLYVNITEANISR